LSWAGSKLSNISSDVVVYGIFLNLSASLLGIVDRDGVGGMSHSWLRQLCSCGE